MTTDGTYVLRNGEELVWWKCVLCCLHTLLSALIFNEKFSVKFSTVKMHSVEELGTNVPAFLAKLWKLVEDSETNDLICWSSNGESFLIRDQARFSRELLPMYYKHNNMASFVRQLNMYGFHKVVSIEGGGLKVEKDEMEFAHQFFMMGHPYLLEHIKRKIPTSKLEEGRTGAKPELSKVLADVTSMKGRQDSLDSQLKAMKRENEVLWREVAILREKHRKQQHIVNKLIQFLVTLVQSSRNGGLGIKRPYPLMLNDTSHRPSKISKPSSGFSNGNSTTHTLSPTGPVIHELDAPELFEDCEADPGETTVKEAFLPSEFCNVVINDGEEHEHQGSTVHTTQNELPPGSPDSITSNPSTEVLLELAEECPLSPSLLITASPMDVNPVIGAPKSHKGKERKRESLSGSKKRRLKRCHSNMKTSVTAASPTPNTSPKALSASPGEGVDLLDMIFPTTGDLKTYTNSEAANHVEVNEDLLTPNSLAAATDAAISGIIMTPASKNKSFKLTDSLGSKHIFQAPLDGILPVSSVTSNKCASPNLADSAVSESDASSNAKPKTSDLMICKQEPSTSSDQTGSSSNMILARTGINSEENCFERIELDSHVDTVQLELESLRELLRGQEYNLDVNTLLGLFGEDPLPITAFENLLEDRDKQITGGSELATYTPNLLDMVEMFGNSAADDWSSPSTPESSSVMDVTLSELNTPQTTVPSPSAKKIE